MTGGPRIAIDAMGGDSGPAAMIAGASRALRRDPSLRIHRVYGDERRVERRAQDATRTCGSARHDRPFARSDRAEREAEPGDPPRAHDLDGHGDQRREGRQGRRRALRRQYRRDDGHVQARAAHHARDRPPGARRACCRRSATPTSIMLDLGANTECDAQNLVQFAVMGSAYARTVLSNPQAAREAAQHRHRGIEGHRRAQGSRRPAARGRLPAVPLRRLHRGRPAVARPCRRRRHRRLLGQHRAQDRRRDGALRHRSVAPRVQELAAIEGRIRAVASPRSTCSSTISTPTITMARSSSASTGWS